MKATLNRALQFGILLTAISGVSATTAFCQSLFGAPVTRQDSLLTQNSLFAQPTSFAQPASLTPELASSPASTETDAFVRDSEGIRQLPTFHFAAYKSTRTFEDLLPVKTNDTIFVSQSRVPLIHFWGGRLQISGFTSTVKMENVLLGPAAESALQSLRLMQQARFSAAHSIDLYGVSVGFRLSPPTETTARAPIWSFLQSIRE